ncbi:MAG: transporter substrate-binding domain-containing protein [Leptolyngbyaceae cyanobacterium HOT.MB2.61]|nr:transporter substrate-binding domain-containing protein [Leptolyngbyaceae cyanobacterium HOT.MB2.61]
MFRKLSLLTSRVLSFCLVGVSVLASPPAISKELKTLREQGRLTVAVKDNLRPLGFRGADGQLQGLEIEIAQRLAQELLGRTDGLVLKPVLNQDRLTVVLDGRADLAVARVTMTSVRSRVVAFSIPYYEDGTALVTKEPTLQSSLNLTNQTIAVLDNSDTIAVIRHRLPQAKLVGVASYQAALELLERGEAIAFAADASVLSGWVQENPQYRLLTPNLSVEPLCIVLPKGLQYDELRRQINIILTRWKAEGWLKQRAAYWGLP